MNKKLIRLTESDLHRIVKESVNKVLNEIGDTPRGQYHLGRSTMRKLMNHDGEGAAEIDNYSKSKGITDGDWMTSPYYRGMASQARYMHSLRGNADDDMSPDDHKNTIKTYDEYYKNNRL